MGLCQGNRFERIVFVRVCYPVLHSGCISKRRPIFKVEERANRTTQWGKETMSTRSIIAILCMGLTMMARASEKEPKQPTISSEPFGIIDGKLVTLYTLRNAAGMEAKITNYGGILVSLLVPDRDGKFDDIVLGYDSLAEYVRDSPYFGAIIGRFGNRIARGKFSLEGKEYTLAVNSVPHHLHGGVRGFDKVVWNAKTSVTHGNAFVELTYISIDNEEGYPGSLRVTVRYNLTLKNQLTILYEATTDKPTVLNLTNHSYFNLAGAGNGDILGHRLMVHANTYTPVDSELIPTGELAGVEGTPFDFRKPTAIGTRLHDDNMQLRYGGGYDHNFVLDRAGDGLERAATVEDPASGRVMEVKTNEPGLQFYSGNFLDGHNIGKGGKPYQYRFGFCLETQHFPDSPNESKFPSTVLRPGQTYRTTTSYGFSIRRDLRHIKKGY